MRKVVKTIKKGNMTMHEIYDDGEPVELEQQIQQVTPTHVKVLSRNLKEYWVKLSDVVRMTMDPKPMDTAIVKTFENGWLVTDIIPYVEEVSEFQKLYRKSIHEGLTPEEEERWEWLKENDPELKRQRKSAMDLMGGY